MGFSGIVDGFMGFSLLGGVRESGDESAGERDRRDDGEARRVMISREAVVPPPPPEERDGGEKVGLWEDAAWLFSVAARALT
jgi:hypothetical protein